MYLLLVTTGKLVEIYLENKSSRLASMIEGFKYIVVVVVFLEKLMLQTKISTRNYETLNDKIHDLNE